MMEELQICRCVTDRYNIHFEQWFTMLFDKVALDAWLLAVPLNKGVWRLPL